MNYTIKLLAVAMRQENGIALNVYPAFVPRSHPLASVKDLIMQFTLLAILSRM